MYPSLILERLAEQHQRTLLDEAAHERLVDRPGNSGAGQATWAREAVGSLNSSGSRSRRSKSSRVNVQANGFPRAE
jgi:hypothetical protein